MNLPVVDCADTSFREVALLKAVAANKLADFSERLELHPVRAMLSDETIDPIHAASPSRSATIASMAARNSACRATIPAILALSALMSTASLVSSCST